MYKKLERDLSEANLDETEPDATTFINTRAHTIEPEFPRKLTKNGSNDKIFNNLIKLSNKAVQSHLTKLKFENGMYKLNPSDSTKWYFDRPINEIYSGQPQKK